MAPTVLKQASAEHLRAGSLPRALPQLKSRHAFRSAVIGHGKPDFEAAADRLMTWGIHERAGVSISSSTPTVAVGTVVLLKVRVLGIPFRAPCEVTKAWRSPRSCGFTYRALPGHPEDGVETFTIDFGSGDDVRFTVEADSRPGSWLTVLGSVVARRVQGRVNARYLAAATS
jgi:uncharacterized protein (UPF0548 family)